MHCQLNSHSNIHIEMTTTVKVYISSYSSRPVHFLEGTKAREVVEALKSNSPSSVLYRSLGNTDMEVVTRPDEYLIVANTYRLSLDPLTANSDTGEVQPVRRSDVGEMQSARRPDANEILAARRQLFASYSSRTGCI
jgi:hypothetical protein